VGQQIPTEKPPQQSKIHETKTEAEASAALDFAARRKSGS
jgi:hypothetical protein